jgi:hypothetical protein
MPHQPPPPSMSTSNGSTETDPVLRSIAETKATYKRLGTSGLRVSVPIFGAMSFGDPAWQPWVIDEEKALPLLKAAYDRGLNTWDTANVYSNGVSEEIIGKAIKKYEIPRNKIVILSKCYGYVGEEPGIRGIMYGQEIAKSKDYVNRGGEFSCSSFHHSPETPHNTIHVLIPQQQASPAPPSSKPSPPPSPACNSTTSTCSKSTASTRTRR